MTGAHRPDREVYWCVLTAAAGAALAVCTSSRLALAADMTDPGAVQGKVQALAVLPPVAPPKGTRITVDHSGRREAGKASIYGAAFEGRTMADGRRYDPRDNVAASRSLPLGTTARVTNLRTGKSTEVKIEDRGPFVAGRVVDLTPHAAHAIGLTTEEGLAPVIVAPIAVPQSDGRLEPGAGAAPPESEEASNQ